MVSKRSLFIISEVSMIFKESHRCSLIIQSYLQATRLAERGRISFNFCEKGHMRTEKVMHDNNTIYNIFASRFCTSQHLRLLFYYGFI